jgi:putative methyltransferase (TIGR04325 family)
MVNAVQLCPLRAPSEEAVRPHRSSQRGLARLVGRLRLGQVRAVSTLMRELTRLRPFASLVALVRKWPLVRQAVDLMAGYNRVFPDLGAARKVAQRYAEPGHESSENLHGLQAFLAKMWPSDYPVLFHLARLPLEGLRVFDLGGTTGDLFWLYNRYINFPISLRWTVHDLPGNLERGLDFAQRQGELRLQFADDIHEASGHDVLLVSGALHYFDFTLADYLAGLARRPKHVFVNRTPLVDAPTAATVTYNQGVMVACRLINRAELVGGMERLGYRLVDSWRAPELSIKLPYDPEYGEREYSGVYFRDERLS